LEGVSGERMMTDIVALSAIPTRHVHSPGIVEAAEFIAQAFRQAGVDRVEMDEFQLEFRGYETTQRNVVAVLPGTDPSVPAIVLGAHYDSRTSDIADSASPAPGANDNATGVAVLLEVARAMADHPGPATIYLVAFAAEETGLQGSQHFVKGGLAPGVGAMAAFDIVGNSSGPDGASAVRVFSEGPEDSASRSLARRMVEIGTAWVPDLAILVQDAIDRPGRYSDHVPFSEAGVPAVRFIEDQERVEFQHNSLDTADRIDSDYLARVARLALAVVTVLGEQGE
jgi:Zn-dependent M28 family amino/carboxypeptidase